MRLSTPIKTFGIAVTAIAMTAGTAYAGNGKDCKNKTHAAAPASSTTTMTSTTVAPHSAVLPASAERASYAAKKKMKVLTFDEALELCQSKGVTDLQACVDKKTGVTKPES